MTDRSELGERCLAALPAAVLDALRSQRNAAIHLVGGCVRDVLLGRATHDFDLAVDGDALHTGRALARALEAALVPLDAGRGSYRIVPRTPLESRDHLDLTQLRSTSIERDLVLRDFTVNALAVPIAGTGHAVVDPSGGLDDLAARRLRTPSEQSFEDDPLRLLRLVRFTVELGFEGDPHTVALARAAAPLLSQAAFERQRDELARILDAEAAYAGVRLLDSLGLLSVMLPELAECRGVEQPSEHYFDVFEHCVHTLSALSELLAAGNVVPALPAWLREDARERLCRSRAPWRELAEPLAESRPRAALLKLAGLLHDISKPETKTVDAVSGRTRFFGHDHRGAERAAAALRRLRFSAREVDYVAMLVDQHLRPGMLAAPGQPPTARALYRFFRDLGAWSPDLFLLNLADHAAARGPLLDRGDWVRHVDYAAAVLRILYEDDQVARPPKLIDGHDLIDTLQLRPGPVVGRLLELVREAQAAGEVVSRESALELARAALRDDVVPAERE